MGPKARTVKFYSTVSDRSEVVHLISRLFGGDGGPGSGNHGHKGRPGQVGGSAPADGAETSVSTGPSGVVHIKIDPKNQKMVSAPLKNGPKSVSSIKREYNDLNNEYVELNKKLAVAMPINERNKLESQLRGVVSKIRAMREDLANAGEKVGNIGELTQTAKYEEEIEAKGKEFDEAEKKAQRLLNEWGELNAKRLHEKDPQKKAALAKEVAEKAQEVTEASGEKNRLQKELMDLQRERDRYNRKKNIKGISEIKSVEEFDQAIKELKAVYRDQMNVVYDLGNEYDDVYRQHGNGPELDAVVQKQQEELNEANRLHKMIGEYEVAKNAFIKKQRYANPGVFTSQEMKMENMLEEIAQKGVEADKLYNERWALEEKLGKTDNEEEARKLREQIDKIREKEDKLGSERRDMEWNYNEVERSAFRKIASENETLQSINERIDAKQKDVDDADRRWNDADAKVDALMDTVNRLRRDGEDEEAQRILDSEEYQNALLEKKLCSDRVFRYRQMVDDLRSAKEALKQKEQEKNFATYGGEPEYYRAQALGHFGTTDDYHESGWILSDGQMLDYSDGMHDGERHHDHREIGEVFPEGSYSRGAMIKFRKHGNIRLYPEVPGINLQLGNDMTPEQEQRIRDIIDEINDEGREMFVVDFSDEYGHMRQFGYAISYGDAWGDHVQVHGGEIDADEVIRDIREFIETGDSDELGPGTFGGDSLPPALAKDGGPGSGNFNHAGRPGEVGGSAPQGSGGPGITPTSEKNRELSGMQVRVANSIAKKARKHPKVYDDWATSLTADEAQAIESQFYETHKQDENGFWSENMSEYYERIWRMLASEAKEPEYKNSPVSGKDIVESYDWNRVPYTEPKFGQVIDTQIEDILEKQGFNGVPKIVSKEEMDKFLEEHPDAPIMFRTFSAPDQTTLDQYDSDLEKGAWYVDCGIGGSKYGRGMYTAAALPWNPDDVLSVDDPRFSANAERGQMVVDRKTGRFYQLNESFICTEGRLMDLRPGDYFLAIEHQNGVSFIFRKDDDGKFIELELGEKWEASDLDGFDEMYTINPMPPERMAERDVEVPLEQMKNYIKMNERREKGKDKATEEYWEKKRKLDDLSESVYGYFDDPNTWTNDTELVTAVGEDDDVYYEVNRDGRKIDRSGMDNLGPGNYLITYDAGAGLRHMFMLRVDSDGSKHSESIWDTETVDEMFDMMSKHNPEVYNCKDITPVKPEPQAPKTSTRRMSLDPSAKMIPYEKLMKMFEEYKDNNSSGKRQAKVVDEIAKEEGLSAEQREAFMGIVIINGQESLERARARKEWQRAAQKLGGNENVDRLLDKFGDKYAGRMRPYIKDEGSFAAALGYDAVVCSNYGRTIVVLNRTKLILSDERVEVPREEAS